MKSELIHSMTEGFESKAHSRDDLEFWYARDLQYLLRYSEWRNFMKVVEKAKEACANAGHTVADHFVDVNKMVEII
jgi:DNA-damage-inducible protein D